MVINIADEKPQGLQRVYLRQCAASKHAVLLIVSFVLFSSFDRQAAKDPVSH